MADPYSNFYKLYKPLPSHLRSILPTSCLSILQLQHTQLTPSASSISSLREALPLLSLRPTRHQEEDEDTSCSASAGGSRNKAARADDEADDEVNGVTVALHIGLPSPGAVDLVSRLPPTSEDNAEKEEEEGDDVVTSGYLPIP
ncbi:hypothetical protein C4D60_Mb10t25350 [Musa balbisiana]|uniref:Uncharacterized protein n=1 Tax=Musa balbisiana TaxID=52838 RepID=A0A4S8J163_MUSBA|nr:hypothetical protein C4D60_Mb10t25350 [Musa balbisiana]